MLFMHWVRRPRALARASAGSNRAARMAMIAMTTRSAMRVNAGPLVNLVAGPKLLTRCDSRFIPFINVPCSHDYPRPECIAGAAESQAMPTGPTGGTDAPAPNNARPGRHGSTAGTNRLGSLGHETAVNQKTLRQYVLFSGPSAF